MNKNNLISIIIPVFNASSFLEETIKSIQDQSFKNWEAIFIDDCSTDISVKIIEKYKKKDPRIKLYLNKVNSFPAITRNFGIDRSKGSYIAFLDADDLWEPTKLEKQLKFMQDKDCAFSFTGYEFANKYGVPNGKKVLVPETINYRQALKNTTIWTSTVMLDMRKLTKEQVHMPDIQRGQDTATWWKILKEIEKAYGLNKILSYYRRTSNSLSSNKLVALKRTWIIYRKIEKLSTIYSIYNFTWYFINAILRRI